MKYSLIATAITTLLLLSGCKEDIEAPVTKQLIRPVKLVEANYQQASRIRSFPGTVAAAEISELSFRINGEISERPVLSGQQVTEGQLIARLDDKDLQQDLKNRQADYEFSSAEFHRIESIYEQKLISRSEYEQARTRYIESESRLDKARNNLSYSVLRAPFDGVISNVLVDTYQTITAKQPIVTLQGEDMIEVVIQLPENIVVNVRRDSRSVNYQPSVTFASITEREFKASYKEHSAQANLGSQTYDVTFILPRPDDLRVLPGMTATLHVDISQIVQNDIANTIVIDPRAVVQIDGKDGQYVWRYDTKTGEIHSVKVTLGDLVNTGVQVREGLNQGDKVAVAGLNLLHDGMKVKPMEKQRGL